MITKGETCSRVCPCEGLMAVAIIILVWVSTAMWSRVAITVAAVLILLGLGSKACKSKAK